MRSRDESLQTRLLDLLRQFNIESDRFIEVFAVDHGLHRTDLNAVAHIWQATGEDRPLTPGELARRLSLSPAATSALLVRLERAGHIERSHDTADRRRIHLRMLPSAQKIAQAFFTPLGRQLRDAFEDFSEEELETTARVMQRVLAATTTAANSVRPAAKRVTTGASDTAAPEDQ